MAERPSADISVTDLTKNVTNPRVRQPVAFERTDPEPASLMMQDALDLRDSKRRIAEDQRRQKSFFEQLTAKLGLDVRSEDDKNRDEFESGYDPQEAQRKMAAEKLRKARELVDRWVQVEDKRWADAGGVPMSEFPQRLDQFRQAVAPQAEEMAKDVMSAEFLNAAGAAEAVGHSNYDPKFRKKLVGIAQGTEPIGDYEPSQVIEFYRKLGSDILKGQR